MSEERKGFLTRDQEQTLEKLYEGKGWIEKIDGLLIRLIDDKGLELLKRNMSDVTKETVYEVIDTLFEMVIDPLVEDE